MELVGRNPERQKIKELIALKKSAFTAVFGRRRVGKTYLIREYFKEQFTFTITGLANSTTERQLENFSFGLSKFGLDISEKPKNWFEAFQLLIQLTEKSAQKKKIIFIDEMPWFDTAKSDFVSALEHFWNDWASARKDILLIVCGSSASWMINKLINNTGGLHNRVTHKMKIKPFTLQECETFFTMKGISWDRYQILQTYMVTGGIPYYLEAIDKRYSATQNINNLCFKEDGVLINEFENLYASLFKKHDKHVKIVEALSKKKQGLTRDEIITATKLPNGGTFSKTLKELDECGFIRKYTPFGKKNRESIYQLVDFYTLFYFQFIHKNKSKDENYWIQMIDNPKHRSWSGYAFELVGLMHEKQIKKALGISGVQTDVYSWRSKEKKGGAQIDLIIDRRDQVVNLFEMKYSINEFEINAKYAENLRNKVGLFRTETQTRKAVFLSMLTTYGVKRNSYSGLVQNDLSMDILFEA